MEALVTVRGCSLSASSLFLLELDLVGVLGSSVALTSPSFAPALALAMLIPGGGALRRPDVVEVVVAVESCGSCAG